MKNIVSVGIDIPSTKIDFYKFNGKNSLSDADIIIFSPIIDMLYRRDIPEIFQGKIRYCEDSSFHIQEDMHHWEKELKVALKSGKTVFIFLSPKKEFYVFTGEEWLNINLINSDVMIYDNYKFLPIDIRIHSVIGQTIICQSSMFRSFYNDFKERLSYEVTIESSMIKEYSFTTKSKDRCLGTYLPVFNGHIVFIPMLYHDDDVFWKKDGTPSQKGEYFGKQLLSHIVEIDKVLTCNAEKTPKPMWLNHTDYVLKDVALTNFSINSNLQKIKKLEDKNSKLYEELIEHEKLMDLLYESGKALENAVIKALKILGYHAENYNDGTLELDQVITSPENERYIGECEGKDNKDIDVGKFRQLQDSLNEDFQRDDVKDKAFGLLFGNPQRLINPTERTLDFTEKCKRGAEREHIGLIKTSDLFIVAKYLLENNDDNYRVECRRAIKNQLGKLIQFPKISKNES